MARRAYDARPRMTAETLLDHVIAETPAAAALMGERTPARAHPNGRGTARSAPAPLQGDRWLLVGDAGAFLDPVFSTGVAIALESGIEAGRALDRALATGDIQARAFAAFERRHDSAISAYRRFVLAFYASGFRDLLFQPVSMPVVFRAVVTSLAGYWRPSWSARAWQRLFFLLTRLPQKSSSPSQSPEWAPAPRIRITRW